jgi:diguanylate cyclase (GGDEF)-like protein/PAS domain S-box-containing protein
MIADLRRRLTYRWHFAPHTVVVIAGIAASIVLLIGSDMPREGQIAYVLSGLTGSVALAALVRFLAQRETQRVAQAILEALPNPVYFKSPDGRYGAVNKAWEAFLGVHRSAVIGKTAQELDSGDRAVSDALHSSDGTLWQRPGFQVYEDVISTAAGARHNVIICKATCADAEGQIAGLVGTIIDITDLQRIERRQAMEHAVTRVLSEAKDLHDVVPALIRTVCETMGWQYGAIYKYYAKGGVLRCEEMWGLDEPNISQFMAAVARRTVQVDGPGEGLVRRSFALGKPIWISDVATDETLQRKALVVEAGLHGAFAFPIRDGDEVLGIVEFFNADILEPDAMLLDVAESIGSQIGQYMVRRRAETERHVAMHDAVTGLPTRLMFTGALEHAIIQAQRHQRLLAVMFIDLDRFKLVNDTLGHEAGDMLLREVSRRLKVALRAGDTVGRLGGDEFVMLLEDITSAHDMLCLGEKLIVELAMPYSILDTEVTVTASVGVAIFPTDGIDGPALLRSADAAMYNAKANGRNHCQLYSAWPEAVNAS